MNVYVIIIITIIIIIILIIIIYNFNHALGVYSMYTLQSLTLSMY